MTRTNDPMDHHELRIAAVVNAVLGEVPRQRLTELRVFTLTDHVLRLMEGFHPDLDCGGYNGDPDRRGLLIRRVSTAVCQFRGIDP